MKAIFPSTCSINLSSPLATECRRAGKDPATKPDENASPRSADVLAGSRAGVSPALAMLPSRTPPERVLRECDSSDFDREATLQAKDLSASKKRKTSRKPQAVSKAKELPASHPSTPNPGTK
jgi:hypothetical protein